MWCRGITYTSICPERAGSYPVQQYVRVLLSPSEDFRYIYPGNLPDLVYWMKILCTGWRSCVPLCPPWHAFVLSFRVSSMKNALLSWIVPRVLRISPHRISPPSYANHTLISSHMEFNCPLALKTVQQICWHDISGSQHVRQHAAQMRRKEKRQFHHYNAMPCGMRSSLQCHLRSLGRGIW